jgi:hypothetical protein
MRQKAKSQVQGKGKSKLLTGAVYEVGFCADLLLADRRGACAGKNVGNKKEQGRDIKPKKPEFFLECRI